MSYDVWHDNSFIMNTTDVGTEKTIAHAYNNKYSINILELSQVSSICGGFLSPWLTSAS